VFFLWFVFISVLHFADSLSSIINFPPSPFLRNNKIFLLKIETNRAIDRVELQLLEEVSSIMVCESTNDVAWRLQRLKSIGPCRPDILGRVKNADGSIDPFPLFVGEVMSCHNEKTVCALR